MPLKAAQEGTRAYFSENKTIPLTRKPYTALDIEAKKAVPVLAYSKKIVRIRCRLFENLFIQADVPRDAVELLIIPGAGMQNN